MLHPIQSCPSNYSINVPSISPITLITYVMAIPIGIYSATRQYSVGDYLWTFFGFVGLATPNFLLAMILMLVFSGTFGMDVGGLFSVEYELSAWSIAKVWDLIKHLPIPIVVLGTAGLIRVLRGSLLDELAKNYVVTAQAKGLPESRLIFKYPVRIALNPIIRTADDAVACRRRMHAAAASRCVRAAHPVWGTGWIASSSILNSSRRLRTSISF